MGGWVGGWALGPLLRSVFECSVVLAIFGCFLSFLVVF